MDTTNESRWLAEKSVNNDQTAYQRLYSSHAPKLLRMLSYRMDPRLRRRVEPADIVQEAFAEAHRRLPEFLEKDGYSFYAWLRMIAMSRLQDAYRRHILTDKRTVSREQSGIEAAGNDSMRVLLDRLVASGVTPSHHVRTSEMHQQLMSALESLTEQEHDLLVFRFIEELSPIEIAQILDMSERTVRRKQRDALMALGAALERIDCDGNP